MNKKQQEQYIAFFQEIYEAEQALERAKKKLQSTQRFSPVELFQSISEGSPWVSISRMRQYLLDRVACNERQLYELFEKLDISRQGFISQQDFIRQITPIDQAVRNQRTVGSTVTAQAEGHWIALLMEYLNRFRILEVARKQVYHILPYNAFAEIDNYKTGLIGLGQLKRFFDRNDFSITEQQIVLLLHGLRRRCYLQVNLQVFCQNLQPLEFGYYEQYNKNIENDNQQQFLKRSRKQQETMRRSRIESRKIQHNIAKQERRRKAELERQLQLQQRINSQLVENQRQKERLMRRAVLEQDKNIRWNIETGSNALQLQKQKYLAERLRNQQLSIIRNQQNDIKGQLVRNALRREDNIENSRRVRYELERQAELQRQLELQNIRKQRQYEYERQKAIQQEIQRERELKLRQNIARQRHLLEQEQRRKQSQRRQWAAAESNRKYYEDQLRVGRERALRDYELQRIRRLQMANSRPVYQTAANSRRTMELDRQLERTRMEMRDRQNRIGLSDNKGLPQTADRSYIKYR